MIARLRRVRVPPALAGYGPGRPASSAPAAVREEEGEGGDSADVDHAPAPAPASASTSTSTASPASFDADPVAPARQKMPRGSGSARPASPGGPSTDALDPDAGRDAAWRALAASTAPLPPLPEAHEAHEPCEEEEGACPTRGGILDAALSRPDPPPPAALLAALASRPAAYSLHNVALLAGYAARANEFRVQQAAADLLRTERIPGGVDVRVARPRVEDLSKLVRRWRLGDTEPNTAMLKRFPPLRAVERDRSDIAPHDVLCRLHHLYLADEAPTLAAALALLRAVRASNGDELGALHLHLAYTPSPPLSTLEAFRALSSAPYSRETVHRAVLALLRHPFALPDLDALLDRFRSTDLRAHRTPGPETWRHVAQHALAENDEALAHLAFVSGRAALAHDRARAQRRREMPSTAGSGNSNGSGSGSGNGTGPRFLNLGRHAARWERLLHSLSARGWVRRCAAPVEIDGAYAEHVPSMIARWEWRGREGEREMEREREMEMEREAECEKDEELELQQAPPRPRFTPNIDVLLQHLATVEGAKAKGGKKARKKAAKMEKAEVRAAKAARRLEDA